MTVRKKKIRGLVRQILESAGVTAAPVPVEQIARAQGAELRMQGLEATDGSNISGFLYREHGKAIIGVNATHHPNRQRFTVAHELGHLLLHSGVPDGIRVDDVHVDRSFHLRSQLSSEGTDPAEREANFFAAELLMPTHFLTAEALSFDLVDDAAAKDLAKRYGVSVQAMMIRLANLGILKSDLG